jgi:hypothetical protein
VLAGHCRLIGLAGIVGSGAICINHFMVDAGAAMSVDISIRTECDILTTTSQVITG